jgi:sulfite reductase (NADPH) hemoprotein beta-component
VARIAYLASDVIVSVQPARAIESEFSSHLHRYAARKDRNLVAATSDGVPEVGYCICPGVSSINTFV